MAVLIADHVAAHPDTAAAIDDTGSTTWAEIATRVDQLVDALRARGLTEGDTVALMAGNQREALEVALACLHSGLLLVPVNWHWIGPELAHVLNDSGAAALIVDHRWLDVARDAVSSGADSSGSPGTRIAIGAGATEGFEDYETVLVEAGPGSGADPVRGGVMFYTSGTTGFPKGVKGPLAGLGGGVEMWQLLGGSIAGTIELAPRDPTFLLCGPIHHSAQWVFTMASLLSGATIVMQHRFDPEAVLSAIDRHAVTNTHLVPAQMHRLLRVPEAARAAFDGSSLYRVHHGAAPCPERVKRELLKWWGPVLWEYYGGTEGGFIAMASARDWLERPGTVGRATSMMEIVVLGPDGEELPAGQVGDIYFRSVLGTSFEYHNAPDKTEAAHAEPGLATLGDVGHLDEDGYLYLSDRRIDMIISGGVNIYPAEIERVLASHPDVTDVAVFGIPHDEMGEQVMAVVEPVDGLPGPTGLIDALETLVREELAGYKRPRRWELVEALPRTDAGKLQKRALRDPYWADGHV